MVLVKANVYTVQGLNEPHVHFKPLTDSKLNCGSWGIWENSLIIDAVENAWLEYLLSCICAITVICQNCIYAAFLTNMFNCLVAVRNSGLKAWFMCGICSCYLSKNITLESFLESSNLVSPHALWMFSPKPTKNLLLNDSSVRSNGRAFKWSKCLIAT